MTNKALLKVIVPLVLLLVVGFLTDTRAVWARLQAVNLAWFAAAIATFTALTALMARRWQLVAQTYALDLPYRRALREYYLAQLWNQLLPGGVAGDAARAVRLRHEGDLKRAAGSVVQERLLGQLALFMLLLVGFAGAFLWPGGLPWPPFAGWAFWAAIACCALIVALQGRGGSIVGFLQQTGRLAVMPAQVALGVLITALLIFSFYACAAASGTFIPVPALATLIPLILTAMLIPLSVGGWGWREGAAAALFPIIGAAPSAGVAAGVTYGVAMLLASAPALLLLVLPIETTSDAE